MAQSSNPSSLMSSRPLSPLTSHPSIYQHLSLSRPYSRFGYSPSTSRPQTANSPHVPQHNNKNNQKFSCSSFSKLFIEVLLFLYVIVLIVRNSSFSLWLFKHPLYFIISPLQSSDDLLSMKNSTLTNNYNKTHRIPCNRQFCSVWYSSFDFSISRFKNVIHLLAFFLFSYPCISSPVFRLS